MSLIPLGVSGSSGGGGSGDLSVYSVVAAPGAVYELSRWTGYTLRHLSFSWINTVTAIPLGGVYITNRLPDSLHPKDMDPQALWATFVYTGRVGGTVSFDFDPGLIWVGPGETLYIVVCDLMAAPPSSEGTAKWTLNTLWEPYGR